MASESIKASKRKIFRKFYQVGATSKGSGLGLYMTQQVAKMHGGTITISSEGMGRGSTFSLILPKETA